MGIRLESLVLALTMILAPLSIKAEQFVSDVDIRVSSHSRDRHVKGNVRHHRQDRVYHRQGRVQHRYRNQSRVYQRHYYYSEPYRYRYHREVADRNAYHYHLRSEVEDVDRSGRNHQVVELENGMVFRISKDRPRVRRGDLVRVYYRAREVDSYLSIGFRDGPIGLHFGGPIHRNSKVDYRLVIDGKTYDAVRID